MSTVADLFKVQCIVGLRTGESQKSACRGFRQVAVATTHDTGLGKWKQRERRVKNARPEAGWMMTTTNRETENGRSQGEIISQPGLFEYTARAPMPRNNATTKWKNTVYLRGREDRLQPTEEGKQRRRSEAIKGKEANINTLTDTAC